MGSDPDCRADATPGTHADKERLPQDIASRCKENRCSIAE